ncbi:hypothetical protein ACERII_18240 [Evansella sp. AB-rgal1]|uniref:hypothetical protein n=1 Tax=Evansella sp. AB-rgal1 TaxID=3242696 RepID=UPI00359DD351
MNQQIQVFMEYKIKPELVKEYEQAMEKIGAEVGDYEVTDFQWYKAADQGALYVEMYKVPTMSHYNSIKKWRKDKDHPVFGKLNEYVPGGIEKVHCWAFLKK